MIRGHALEFGLSVSTGLQQIAVLLKRIAANQDRQVPELGRQLFAELGEEYRELDLRLARIEAKLKAWRKDNELCRRLMAVPGIGEIGATMLAIKVPTPQAFRSGRDFAAWIGLTPKDHSTAGKQRHGGITRAGDEALRRVLVSGAMAVIQQVMKGHGKPSPWLADLLKRKPPMLVAVALANQQARVAWKLMVSSQRYDPQHRAKAAARRSAALSKGCAPRRPAAPQPMATTVPM
jgi:transposase